MKKNTSCLLSPISQAPCRERKSTHEPHECTHRKAATNEATRIIALAPPVRSERAPLA